MKLFALLAVIAWMLVGCVAIVSIGTNNIDMKDTESSFVPNLTKRTENGTRKFTAHSSISTK